MSPLWLKHMYSVLSAITWRPMPVAARSRIGSTASSWAGVFARSAVFGVVLFRKCLCGVSSASSLASLTFIISKDVLSMMTWQMINRYWANVFPCRTPATMSVSPSGDLYVFYIASLWLRWFLWVGCRRVVFAPSSFCVWNQRSRRSRKNNIVASRFFARTSRIRRIVKICDVVDRFLPKPFWLLLNIFSILGPLRLRSRAL